MTIAAGLAPRTATATALRRRPALALVQVGVTSAPRAPFVVAVVALLATGLLGLLVLNTVLAKDAFRVHQLQIEARKLADAEQALTREVEAQRASGALASTAAALGMVPAGPPNFLLLPEGTVLGAALPAEALGQGADGTAPAPAPGPAATAPGADDPVDGADAPPADPDAATAESESADESTEDSTDEDTESTENG